PHGSLSSLAVAERVEGHTEVVDGRRHVGMIGAERLFADRENPLEYRSGALVHPEMDLDVAERVEAISHLETRLAERALDRRDAPLERGARFLQLPSILEQVAVRDLQPRLEHGIATP